MSANNGIYINRETLKAYYASCVDNDFDERKEKPIATGKTLDELIDRTEKWLEDNEMYVEYGYNFI